MDAWKNAGVPWYRRRYEGTFDGTHVWAYSHEGVKKKLRKLIKTKVNQRKRS